MADKKPSQDMLDWLGISNAPNWRVARPLGWFIGAVLTVALPLLFFASLAAAGATIWHTITLALNGEQDGINLGAGALIAALLGAPFVIWGTVLKHQTVRYQKEGHITERITKAVEQLGAEKEVKRIGRTIIIRSKHPAGYEEVKKPFVFKDEKCSFADDDEIEEQPWEEVTVSAPNIEVRIGAILSLERIAQDSTRYDNGRDHVRVMEILCAYVRENSNAIPPQDYPEPDWEPLKDDATEEERRTHLEKRNERFGNFFSWESKAGKWAQNLPEPRADTAMALQVLGRRNEKQRRVEAAWPHPLDDNTQWPFDNTCPTLRAGTEDQPLTATEVEAFNKALEEWHEPLRNYSGYRLDLRGANLQRADLSAKRPYASNAIFSGALLNLARLEGANLFKARIEGVVLDFARMEGAGLRAAQMEGASLTFTRMEGASLSWARMAGVRFTWTRMVGVESLNTAWLHCAVLRFCDCSEVAFTQEQINSMFGDRTVTLPKGITRPAHWPNWDLPVLGKHDFDAEYRKWQANPAAYTPPQKPD